MPVIKSHTKFESVKKQVQREIASGYYKLSERLPSERELAVKYGVNRLTVNRALTELVQEQWLHRINGIGTFVTNLLQNKLQKRERCQVHLVTVSLRRSIDVSLSHHALKFFRGLEDVDCTVHETGWEASNEHMLLGSLLKNKDNFVFLTGFCDPRSRKLIKEHADRCVIFGSAPELTGKAIEIYADSEAGGRMMMNHLIANGHQQIAYCGEKTAGNLPGRFHAWKTVLQENGFPAPDEYAMGTEALYDISSSADKSRFVQSCLEHFLCLPKPPTAVFCSNDDLATVMIHLCWHKGLRIPDDLSVCGFDGSVANALESLELTTIRQPYEKFFATAFSLMLEQTPKTYPQILLQPTLIPGKTVKNLSGFDQLATNIDEG